MRLYTASSPAPGEAAYTPVWWEATASAIEFLTGENENQRSKSAKPTLSPGPSSFGKSCSMHDRGVLGGEVEEEVSGGGVVVAVALARHTCIMHSNRVGFLNCVRSALAYLG